MRLSPAYEGALIRALHSVEGAAVRWNAAGRLDDAALLARIGEEFGIVGGFSRAGEWVDFRGGRNPRIEIRIGAENPVELSGRELLAAVRMALKISHPGELF